MKFITIYLLLMLMMGCSFTTNPLEAARSYTRKLTSPIHTGTGGTSFILKFHGTGYTITNEHVCKNAERGYMASWFGGTATLLRVIKKTAAPDLCALETPLYDNDGGLELAEDGVHRHDMVWSHGFPFLTPLTPTSGEVLGTDVWGQEFAYLITTLKVLPGQSGSPVLNASGAVVGVVFALDLRTHQGLVIGLQSLRGFLEKELP
jgi:S1-C subfamily serine protease